MNLLTIKKISVSFYFEQMPLKKNRKQEIAIQIKLNQADIDILQSIQQINQSKKLTTRELTIQAIYNVQEEDDITYIDMYSRYTLIKALISMDQSTFEQLFDIQSKKDVQILVEIIQQQEVQSIKHLKILSSVCKYMKYANIYLTFNKKKLQFDKIPDNIWNQLLDQQQDNIKLLSSNQSFIIVQNTETNEIEKLMPITNKDDLQNTNNQIEKFLLAFSNNNTYNIILVAEQFLYESLGNINAQSLSYSNLDYDQRFMSLTNPQMLISATLDQVQLKNIGDCVNLQILYSARNSYKKEDLQQLSKLKYIHSWYDTFECQEKCFLEELFTVASPEQIFIWNTEINSNMIKSCTLSSNIINLRYFELYQQKVDINFILDISKEFPSNLKIYNVRANRKQNYEDQDDIIYGKISGEKERVAKLLDQLLNEVK